MPLMESTFYKHRNNYILNNLKMNKYKDEKDVANLITIVNLLNAIKEKEKHDSEK
jgi:hypothetical protein